MQAHVLLFGLQDYAHKCRDKRLNPDIDSDEVHMMWLHIWFPPDHCRCVVTSR